MPRPRKGKAKAPTSAPEEGGDGGLLDPIPEDPGYEGYNNYRQGGEAWQHEETTWDDGAAYDQGYAQGGGDQWGHPPGSQPEAWDAGQYPQPQQQEWPQPTNFPAAAPPSTGSASYPPRNPQGAYGAPRSTHVTPQQPPAHPMAPAAPPSVMPPSRSRQDSGMATGAPGWQAWDAEARAYGRHFPPPPPPPPPPQAPGQPPGQPPGHPPGTGYGPPTRVAFASHDSYIPFGDQAEADPQAQRMIFDSLLNSRGGAPKHPQQRSTRSSAQNSMHIPKQSKKSKKERRAQEQNPTNVWGGQQENSAWGQDPSGMEPENPGWNQGNPEWEQENTQWDGEGYGWDQQNPDGKEKQEHAWNQWGPGGEVGRDDLDSEGYTDSEGWNDVAGRRNHQRTVSSPFVPGPIGDSPYPMRNHRRTVSSPFVPGPIGGSPHPMSSRTMAYATATAQDSLEAFSPGLSHKRNTIEDSGNIESLESFGEAMRPVENAFFGRERKARDRIHWQFPHDKDDRVRQALEWLQDNAHGVGAFGLTKFLQTRERGALFINASYDGQSGDSPALDWLTYEDVVETRDRLLQESVGFYDPAMQVIVFVFLPSKTGNSLAMWRRKVPVPNSVRLAHFREIDIARAALRKEYTVLVDEMRSPPYRLSSLQGQGAPKKKKKKGFFRRLFRIFKIIW